MVVEHDIDTMRQADYLLIWAQQQGFMVARVTAFGTPKNLRIIANSLTGAYLAGKRKIDSHASQLRTAEWLFNVEACE